MSEPQPGSFAPEELTVGGILAAARAERGLSVTEVAQRLKFSTRQIDALEADQYESLPSAPFVRGMVRSYAKLLGIDAAPLLGSLERKVVAGEVEVQPHGMSVPFPAERRTGSRVYALLSIAIVLAVAVILAEWFVRVQRADESTTLAPPAAEPLPSPGAPGVAKPIPGPEPAATQSPTVAAAAPAASSQAAATPSPGTTASEAPAAVVPVARGSSRVAFEFEQESWVEIRNVSGEVIFSGLNRAGTRRVVQGAAPFEVVIGNASGVRLTFNSVPVDLRPHTKVDVARLTLE